MKSAAAQISNKSDSRFQLNQFPCEIRVRMERGCERCSEAWRPRWPTATKRCRPNPESRIPNPGSRIPNPESRIPNPEPRDPGNNNSTPLQGYLAHKIPPPPPGPPYEPRHGPTVGSYGVAVSYERGTPVGLNPCVIRHPTPGTRVPTLEIQPVIPPRSFRSFRF